ncbi:MAG: gliding motility protein GldN [Muribaculaceae bacterium]
MNFRKIIISLAAALTFTAAFAQVESAGGVRKRSERDKTADREGPKVSGRMQDFFETKAPHDADLYYMREIYRQLDLTKAPNSPLYYPEDVVDGKENLFRIILRLVVDGSIPAYEYLDGREVFTDKYQVKVADMLDRFGIYAQRAKGSTEKNPRFEIDEADVPSGRVLNYYIIEKWEFDRRSNRMKTRVEAICPVLNRSDDYGGETRYPMFWVKFDALRPYLAQQYVFLSDDNNLEQYSIDDYFNLGMYDGEIYKTRNLRNLSMAQMFPDEDDRRRAQDSIDNRLRSYGKNLWVPTREEFLAMKEKEALAEQALANGDSIPDRTTVTESSETPKISARAKKRSSTKKKAPKRAKQPKVKSSGTSASSSAEKSVRRRRR